MKKFLLLLGAILIAALLLKAGIVAFASYVLLGVFLLSRYLAKQSIENLSVKRLTFFPEQAEEGDEVTTKILVRNRGKVPILWVLIEDLVPEHLVKANPARLRIKGKRLRFLSLRPHSEKLLKYTIICERRGYYQIGPTLVETGDFFGLHRRHRIVTRPAYLMVLPKPLPLPKYDFASERPVGEVKLAHRLFEDPTRPAGVRPYQYGDPLQRIHWKATARSGTLQSRVYEPTSLVGATLLLDFHKSSYEGKREPYTSELAVRVACSLAQAVAVLNQPIGFASNGLDAAELIRLGIEIQSGSDEEERGFADRESAKANAEAPQQSERIHPILVPTRRGPEQFQLIREALARVELTEGLSFTEMIVELLPRFPRDATILAILPHVSIEIATSLGQLRKQGFAVTAVIINYDEEIRLISAGRLLSQGVRDFRFITQESDLAHLGSQMETPPDYGFSIPLV
jgi:uncharacterized repeat protein (TIGR01451 family)